MPSGSWLGLDHRFTDANPLYFTLLAGLDTCLSPVTGYSAERRSLDSLPIPLGIVSTVFMTAMHCQEQSRMREMS